MATFFIWYHWRDNDAGTHGRDHWDDVEASTPLEALSRWLSAEAEAGSNKWCSMDRNGWHAEAPVNRDDLPKLFDTEAQEVAFLFAKNIELWLTKEELAEVNRKNGDDPDPTCCYTHDHCDPNQAMINALSERGYTIDIQSEEQTRLMYDAWAIARRCQYSAKKVAEDARGLPTRNELLLHVGLLLGLIDGGSLEVAHSDRRATEDDIETIRKSLGLEATC